MVSYFSDGWFDWIHEVMTAQEKALWNSKLPTHTTLSSHNHVKKTGDLTSIEIEMPGVKPSDVEVSLEDRFLKVSWKSRLGIQEKSTFQISQDVDPSKLKAKVSDGLFTLDLHRDEVKKKLTKILVE